MRILVDSNVVVRIFEDGHPEQIACTQALRQLFRDGDTPCLCAQTAIEFWSVATRPKRANGLALTPAAAESALRDTEQWSLWLPEPADIAVRWRRLVNRKTVCGKEVHDARFVAFMQAHGLTSILTLNTADFARYDGIRCVLPGDVR